MELTPLQEEKTRKVNELMGDEGKQEIPVTEVKKPRKPRKTRKKKQQEEDSSELEAGFLLGIFEQGRMLSLGIDKPISPEQKVMFVQTYKGMVDKYGDFLGKYMVEASFSYAVFMIAFDTFVEYKKIRSIEKVKESENNDTGNLG